MRGEAGEEAASEEAEDAGVALKAPGRHGIGLGERTQGAGHDA